MRPNCWCSYGRRWCNTNCNYVWCFKRYCIKSNDWKPLLIKTNVAKRLQWCMNHRDWSLEQWKSVIFSDKSSFTLFPTTGRVYFWRQPKEAFDPDCLHPTLKHGRDSVMTWGTICWKSSGPMISLHGRINSRDYLKNSSDQIHLMVQTLFPERASSFKMILPQSIQLKMLKNGMRNILVKLSISCGRHNPQTSTLLSIYSQFQRFK